MANDIVLGDKAYVSSKKAAQACGYAQDYVGQLARGGVIEAQRVGGLWYVSMDSLEAYKRNAEAFKPEAPVSAKVQPAIDTVVNFDGKDYVSAAKAAKLTGYNPDYVGQLARGGKVLSRQVGNRWYVEREGLLSHKAQKDALLAGVQAEAVGLSIPAIVSPMQQAPTPTVSPFYTYVSENHDLLPSLKKREVVPEEVVSKAEKQQIAIRVIRDTPVALQQDRHVARARLAGRSAGNTIGKAVKATAALTVVIVVSYGIASIKSESIYAYLGSSDSATQSVDTMLAAASGGVTRVGDMIEKMITEEIRYSR